MKKNCIVLNEKTKWAREYEKKKLNKVWNIFVMYWMNFFKNL